VYIVLLAIPEKINSCTAAMAVHAKEPPLVVLRPCFWSVRAREALCILFEDPVDKGLLLSNRESFAMLVCYTSIWCSIKIQITAIDK
jgi:hypothetical protein